MALARVHFQQMIQDSQEYGSDEEHMVSRVFFALELEGSSVHTDLYADVKQTVGSSFETAPLEVSMPHGYKGPWDHEAFSQAVEAYYRGLVGASGRMIRIEAASNVRMRNNRYVEPRVVEFHVKAHGGAW